MVDVISNNYLEEQKRLHKLYNYGIASISHAPNIKKILEETNIKNLSDYGAGKKNLQKELIKLGCKKFNYYPYDPVFPEYGKPVASELVCCIDVMEHIEEIYLNNVLDELKRITLNICYFSIASQPAKKELSDGTNAHLIQNPPRWWLPKLCERFQIQFMNCTKSGFIVICRAL